MRTIDKFWHIASMAWDGSVRLPDVQWVHWPEETTSGDAAALGSWSARGASTAPWFAWFQMKLHRLHPGCTRQKPGKNLHNTQAITSNHKHPEVFHNFTHVLHKFHLSWFLEGIWLPAAFQLNSFDTVLHLWRQLLILSHPSGPMPWPCRDRQCDLDENWH